MNKFVRFSESGSDIMYWGFLDQFNRIELLSDAPWKTTCRKENRSVQMAEIELSYPCEPTKIVALGYNFRDLFLDQAAKAKKNEPHYLDIGFEPIMFLKGPNCLAKNNDYITVPKDGVETWIEVEIAAVVGNRCKNVIDRQQAKNNLFGVTIANDVTSLNIFERDWHLARSKSLDSYCPVGPILFADFDDSACNMQTFINGKITQNSNTNNRILDSLDSIIFVSKHMTLEPGDLILTGTPLGARQSLVKAGDEVEVSIDGLGTLKNRFN